MKKMTRFLVALATCIIAFSAAAQPANDMFANAWTLSGAVTTTNGSNVGGSKEAGEPNHANNAGGRSVWFNWTPATGGQVRIDTVGSTFNTTLAVYTGNSVSALTVVAFNNDGPGIGQASLLEFQAVAGTTYRIAIDANRGFFGTPNGGNYVLRIQTLASIVLTSPTNGSVYMAGTTIPISVAASVPTPPVTNVLFYRGGQFLGSDTTQPFSLNDTPPAGTNRYAVIAVDSAGINWTSSVASVAVFNPGITLVSPEDGTTFLNTNPITVTVLTNLGSGSITNVEFYVDGVKFAEDDAAPFSVSWTSVTPGPHRLTAVGRDSSGAVHNSNPGNISVARLVVARGSTWKYLDNGTDQSNAWSALTFNDSSWSSGAAELGYGDGDEATEIGFGPDPQNVFITSFFRRAVVLTDVSSYVALLMSVRRDDGAVVYINGVEAARFNMPAGPVTYLTFADNAQDETSFFPAVVPASLLAEGTNVVAVEVHQTNPQSSDVSFDMDLYAIPAVIRNATPEIAVTSPANGTSVSGAASISVQATASDSDGTVAGVEFFVDGISIGTDSTPPYSATWSNPQLGPHAVTASAIDDQGATGVSSPITVNVFDAAGNPFARITSPANGLVVEGPTNMVINAFANGMSPLASVEFYSNGTIIGSDNASPYSINWNAPFGSNRLYAVALDNTGRRGTSAVVAVTITIPPTNTVAPFIVSSLPVAGSTIASLTSIQVTFSERVINVDAGDLLIDEIPASSVSGSGSNYNFTFPQPGYGNVGVTWAANHGITDIGYPANLPFDTSAPGATWTYNLVDQTPPVIAARAPAANAVVTNLTQISVTFNEPVNGVDASDLLVNGDPAFGVAGTGASYLFSVNQPAAGTVAVTWAGSHGISDRAPSPNPFNATAAGATWNFTLDNRTVLVQSNANWQFVKGQAEASTPSTAWREPGFNDSSWSNALAPFYFGDPYNSAANPGTLLSDMTTYSSIYLRRTFNVFGASEVSNLFFNVQIDDGLIAWINGVEVLRVNMPAGEVPYNGFATGTADEPSQTGARYIVFTLQNANAYLVDGVNTLAVHAFNQSLQSSDFGFNAQLYAFLPDPSAVAPRVASLSPAPGATFYLTNLIVRFTEGVTGVNAADLLVNGVPATSVTSTTNTTYTFAFPRPAFGPVTVSWSASHGIADFDSPPKPFDASSATFQYTLQNPNAPTVALQSPIAGASINTLTQLVVTFSKPVTGVNAVDLRINGAPASGISGSGATYTFTFPQPPYGSVVIGWVAGHGITDLEAPANEFDALRQGGSWSYTLIDQVLPAIAHVTPARGSPVTNLTQISVTFTEPVVGVGPSDLRVNGTPITAVSGTNAQYTFTFPQQNATMLTFTWANNHGIRDLAPVPNSFDASAPGASWSYTTPDTLAPAVAAVDPAPYVTVRSVSQLRVTFTEPVTGVGTNDLLVNNRPALSVSGSGAGPYVFNYLPITNGIVEARWIAGHGITDISSQANPFAGGEWTYVVDASADFAGKILISEIMFNPTGGRTIDEWIELRNVSSSLVNLAGWRLSRGADFTFPNVSIAPGGYLVVAADLAAFQARYPGVANVIGGWTGRLANSDETIELQTSSGETVNSVHYASEGEWARRERGHGAQPALGIVRNGATATVSVFNHGFTGNDRVQISGADQPEYNGIFTLTATGPSTINITVAGTPASPATGNIVVRHVIDDGVSGWSWFSAADGFGSSLELVNHLLPNAHGQNWLVSTNRGGTPGAANSVAAANVAPLILDVKHLPVVPRSTEPVSVTARIQDEAANGIQSVTLFYRNHSTTAPGAFISTNMFDDGAHSDGLSGDRLFGAVLPPSTNNAVIEFYVRSTDTSGLVRTWPAPTWDTNNTFGQLANALYQVSDESITNLMPSIRFVMTGTERATFPPAVRNSDGEMNGTFVRTDGDGTQARYLSSIRVRGAGSRSRTPPNNRINIPNDNRWNGMDAINLNGQFIHAQLMGAAVARKSGVMASDAQVVQYRINNVNPAPVTAPLNGSGNGAGYGAFVMVQPVNGDLADDLFPEDGDGNVYRASTGNHSASLAYLGTSTEAYLTAGYFKTANQTENNWTDLMNLTAAFSLTGSDADYAQAMSTNVNVDAWMRYFALGTLINFGETSLFNGRGDDYALYRGINDPRFIPIGHDFDTIFGQGDTTTGYAIATNSSIYVMLNPPNSGGFNAPNMPLLRRFLTNAQHAPIFFRELKRLSETVFSPEQLNPLFDQLLTGWGNGPTTLTIDAMKTHAANRRAVVLSQIPLGLSITHSLGSSNGYPYTTSASVTLAGSTHAIDTRSVLVNGSPSPYAPWDARWTNSLSLRPGINRVLVQSLDSNSVEFARATLDIWYDDGSVQTVSGAIGSDAVWTAAAGPYVVSSTVTVGAGATLSIQAGTTVYVSPGASISVANGGRLLAQGNDTARIRFSNVPGSGNWGGIVISGAVGSPESRIEFAHIEGNNNTAIALTGGTAFLDSLTFGNRARRYLDLDGASFVVQNCDFPATTAAIEPVHGTGGIKAGGRGIVRRNFWGRVNGYNDSFDFTGGNRPGPILQVVNNVFMGSDDDLLDLDGTDAWVEGNIFLHTHRFGSPDSASAVSGGNDSGQTSEITVIGNLFYDVDQAANAKQGNFYTMLNNTIVRQTKVGSQDTNTAVVILADDGTTQGAGIYLEGNIIVDAENLVRNVTSALVTYTNNFIHQLQGATWAGPGGGNQYVDPLLKNIPPFSETSNYTSWAQAQVLWDHFGLQPGSPAAFAGPQGRDAGGVVDRGAVISGVPPAVTPLNSATLRVGLLRTGNGVPVAGFPNGSGYTHYRWRLDGGPWSTETPSANPISLAGLAPGPHAVEVVARNDAGFYQDDLVFGSDATITLSRTWVVEPASSPLRLSEVLASNGGAVNHFGTTPDLVELYNASDAALDLTGVRLTDDVNNPNKFIFPQGATIPAFGYLVVYANSPDGTPGHHLGFGLGQEGDSVYLFQADASGGALLDSITFGLQLTDLSVGRLPDGTWALTTPTVGSANRSAPIGDPRKLRINEWLAIAQIPFDDDFIELYNADVRPVDLGGLYITDETLGIPGRHQFPALSFIGANAYLRLIADSNPSAGADHVNFRLSGDHGEIGLYMDDLSLIDWVWYQPQLPNVSQGRSPNGSSAIVFFDTPTPGAPNPIVSGPLPFGGALVINEVLASNTGLVENGRTPDWVEIYNGTANPIDLSGMSLTDSTLVPRKFVFATGTAIAAGGHLRLRSDDGLPATNDNTGFGLSSAGGAVYLFDRPASGGTLLNSIVYGIQTPNLSIGRVPSGSTNWVLTAPTPGALNSPITTLGDISNLKVNEWMAAPASGDDWFEIYNPNSSPVAIGGLYLTDDLATRTKHRIAALSFIGNGTNAFQRFVADNNTGLGADHVGFALGAGGEAVGISTAAAALINGVTFGAQVSGVSQGRFPDGATLIVAFPGTDSPGASNWRLLTDVVINEVLTHTDEPLEDAIELRNLTGQPIDISGWWLSDDDRALQKYQIPSPTTIPANGFVVIYENVFTNAELAAVPFALSSGGDEVVLSASSNNVMTGFRKRVDFGAGANGVSFGRYITSDQREEFVPMSRRTFGVDDPSSVQQFRTGRGTNNAYPAVGPIVIAEIMYHPPDVGTNDNTRDEYIKLRNISTVSVPLYDPANATNRWRIRDGVDFDFPGGVTVPPGGSVYVVSFDPVNDPVSLIGFYNAYQLTGAEIIVGPYSGRLSNDDDDIELRRPDAPNTNDVPYLLVERVHYRDSAPWLPQADGTGFSLQRISLTGFGNDPTNWIAAAPVGAGTASPDLDNDGMANSWEVEHGLDPYNSADAGLDLDGDGLTNLQEFQMRTDPRDGQSGLRIVSITPSGSSLVTLQFLAVSNFSYRVEFKDTMAQAWQAAGNVSAVPTNRVINFPVSAPSPSRFYRLRTPQ